MDETRGGTAGDEGGADDDVDFAALLGERPTGGFVPGGGHFLGGGGREEGRKDGESECLMISKQRKGKITK